jgi:glycosyltransferase involved in cell wall biosynthesis
LEKKLISIIAPIYNEEKNISRFLLEVKKSVLKLRDRYKFEFILIDDGSSDDSSKIIQKLARKENELKYIQFTRNFGKGMALSAGLNFAKGDAVVSLDADLQHPPKYIPAFIKKWEGGAEVVLGIRKDYKQKGLIRKIGSYFFYMIQNRISDIKIDSNETDFRLLDRVVVDEFNKLKEHNRITRGLIDWLGFKRDFVEFIAADRLGSKSVYGTLKLVKLAVYSFVSLSLLPLKIVGYFGVFITLLSGLTGTFIFVEEYILNDPLGIHFTGTAVLAIVTIFMVGINLCCLGLISLYIANIHSEVINRPLYVVRKLGNIRK